MNRHAAQGSRTDGFALIVVLFSLLILTALFAIAQNRSLSHLHDAASEERLIRNGQLARDLLDLAIALRHASGDERVTAFPVEVDGEPAVMRLQDVGGLVDLNTASPALLALLADRLVLPSDALARFRAWRRTPRRALRVSDFARVTGLDDENLPALLQIATVYSGRAGIAPEVAPQAVLDMLGASRPEDVPDTLRSPPSGANFVVTVLRDRAASDVPLGVIHVGSASDASRVLALE